jgi:hypothetical protein
MLKSARSAILGVVIVTALILVGISLLSHDVAPVGVDGEWSPLFQEEFSDEALGRQRWSDSETWELDGYALDDAWAPVPATEDQLELRDGAALLKARRATGLAQDKNFTSSSIHTRGKFSLPAKATTYVEARMRAPAGRGLFPAFWLLGNGDDDSGEGWPINGEVDIVEFANNKDEQGRPYFSVWYPADVYSDPPGTFLNGVHDTHPDSFEHESDLRESWHVWGLYRSPERMDVYIDGVRQFGFRPGEIYKTGLPLPEMLFTNDMHIRLSLAVGGEWAGAGWSPEDYEEGELAVDYVRAWVAED